MKTENGTEARTQKSLEVNFDGLVGPTHNYAGLAFGNMASLKHAHQDSNPKAAALQGLNKMQLLMQLGLTQAVLPPHERPNLALLRNVGFQGSDIHILTQAKKVAPALFYACYSSSSMWAANAGTISPSHDCYDRKLHFTPANLISHFHRSLETEMTYRVFKRIFNDETKFVVHPPLPTHPFFGDEGAANHNRLCLNYSDLGLEMFVYGRSDCEQNKSKPNRYPARQTLEASQAVARRHQLETSACFFVKQNPHVIDRGVFHNDVISVINENVFLFHELAFEEGDEFLQSIQDRISFPIYFLKIKESELSVKDAVETYFFNSQLVTMPNGKMALIAPEECREMQNTLTIMNQIIEADNPIQQLHFVDCRESMRNGGGPACLRLRVVLTEEEQKAMTNAMAGDVFLNEKRYFALRLLVERFYRDRITGEDLLDPLLIEESQTALDELTKILNLGSIYSFQMT